MSEASNFSAYIRVTEDDLTPATPRIFLEMEAPPQLSLTMPYYLIFTLRRAEQDGSDRPCIFRWSPDIDGYSPSGFRLLHHTDNNTTSPKNTNNFTPLEHEIDHTTGRLHLPENDSITINGWSHNLWEFRPGDSVRLRCDPPERYYKMLRAGETYTLLYPGGEVSMWDWGTKQEHMGREMKARHLLTEAEKEELGLPPKLMIPGGASVTFTAREEDTPWPGRVEYQARSGFGLANLAEQQWRLEAEREKVRVVERWPETFGVEDRVSGAPILTATLECPPTITRTGHCDITLKVTYTGEISGPNGQASKTTTRPITFRSWSVIADLGQDAREGFWLYRQRGNGNGSGGNSNGNGTEPPWEFCHPDDDDDGCCGFRIYDAPDEPVRVADHEHFSSLRPGETWTTTLSLQREWTELSDDMAVGDLFRYMFGGAVVEWWDWGSAEEHAETVVMLPCWIAGRVVEPRDNGGRPKLVVAHAEPVEFRVAEG